VEVLHHLRSVLDIVYAWPPLAGIDDNMTAVA